MKTLILFISLLLAFSSGQAQQETTGTEKVLTCRGWKFIGFCSERREMLFHIPERDGNKKRRTKYYF